VKELLENLFSAKGTLSHHLPAFEERSAQLHMAEEIAKGYLENRITLIEAGTGIGKSLAYLAPAILWAIREKEKTLISTHTIALQEQLVEKDLPLLLKILGVELKATLVKGMNNYLCLLKYEELEEVSPRLEAWVETTKEGSRSDITFSLPSGTWEKIGAETHRCTGAKCSHFRKCFFFKARKKLEESQLLIVNHHLLLSDLSSEKEKSVLPDINRLILDEAHHLEEIALGLFTKQADKMGLLHLLEHPSVTNRELVVPKIMHAFSLIKIDVPLLRIREDFSKEIQEAFSELSKALLRLVESIDEKEIFFPLKRQTEVLSIFFQESSKPSRVRWIEKIGNNLVCKEADLDVSSVLRENLFDRFSSTSLCSATLASNRSFSFIRHRLGIEDAQERIFDSPFDFQNRVLLAVPSDMPDPIHPDFSIEASKIIAEGLKISKGSAFVLFTSYEMLNECYENLKDQFSILRQGDAARSVLIEKFREKNGNILFGTDSFWEGVDVAGEALRFVILVKIPFKVPDDPLIEARNELLEKEGKNPFMHYLLPQAALKFKQGFGRLMRKKDDYGCVLCLDRRLITKGYGKVILQSLPTCQTLFTTKGKVLSGIQSFYKKFGI
jgi:ATP-dependent DNA helicase DinG